MPSMMIAVSPKILRKSSVLWVLKPLICEVDPKNETAG